jgi:regulator of sigma E protease
MLLSLNLSGSQTEHDLVVIRDGQKLLLEDFSMEKQLVQTENGEQLLYGMMLQSQPRTFQSGFLYAWNTTLDVVRSVRMSLQMLFSGQAGLQDVGGPVMIVDQMTQVADASETWVDALLNLLYYGAFIAVNLAVMNLLPIPALDGGRVVGVLVTAAVEAVIGKKINPKYEGYLHGVGMLLLLALMAIIMFKDIFFLFK